MPGTDETGDFARSFGEVLKEQRRRLGWSQEDFAFEAGLDRTYVSGVERGVRNPTLLIILKLCRALGVRPSTLLRRAEDATGMQG